MAKCKPWLLCCFVVVCLTCVVSLVCVWVALLEAGRCSSGSFRRAAVSADSHLCSDIGRTMLQQGGSAVDGAIAALLCTSVVNPQSMGIGGGSIVTIRNKTGGVQVYNFRETVPRSFKPNLLNDCSKHRINIGSQWIGVPGELRGYEAIHKRYGKLPWAKLFEPTVKLARAGLPVSDLYLARLLNHTLVKGLVENSPLCSLQILCKNKTILSKGDILKFTKLADTMETIAEQGADAFYMGKIGHDLIQDIQAAGGTLKMEDLKSFQVREQDAWTVPLGDFQMHLPPPPAGGALLGFILKLMKEFSFTPNSLDGDHKIQMYHHFIEALKFANGQKNTIRDSFLHKGQSAHHLIDSSFISRIKKMISSNCTHDNHYYNVTPSPDHVGTTHVSVLDEDGLAVSATSTINQIFGGAIYSPQTGVILNNELSDFCGRTDTVSAGEQPPSSMTPVILESKSGELLVIGGSGGSLIPTAMASSIIHHLWLGMNLEDAIAAPIVFVDSKNNVNFELGFDKSVKNGLLGLGHKEGDWKFFLNVVSAVKKEKGCIVAESDKRKMGVASGY
ncbi:glutathione hydrolase 5 proenzyme-like [Solea senegalensis]|uniref:Glutathione hydrolase n=1 Tax=Solea senegalensis TaxID=28829 RepID=A0AAV6S103_SOLSE|nr:glutathione hydrolase 5 proenzyme-like [Solea senegalensis]KAG7511578.1 glutathione hydrolase 5 proenzyme-like [Solea senegalensis]